MVRKVLLPILPAAISISLNEFVPNQLVLLDHWTAHYASMGLTFPAAPINGTVWGIWSLCFAVVIFFIAHRFSLLETAALAWLLGFVLMWLVVGNLGVLPMSILPIAIPLSMVEAFGAAWIVKKLA